MKKIAISAVAAVLAFSALAPQSALASGPEHVGVTNAVGSRSQARTQGLTRITPESRQSIYLPTSQAGVRGGKFVAEKSGGIADPDVPGDIVNREPPRDGQLASAGNPYASSLDAVQDKFGNQWTTHPVTGGQTLTVSLAFGEPTKIRRVSAYLTNANWDDLQPLTRTQLDLKNPLYRRTYTAAPYTNANEEIPVGLAAPSPLEFSFSLTPRTVGHHVLLLEIDHPDSGDATYQVIDLRYTN